MTVSIKQMNFHELSATQCEMCGEKKGALTIALQPIICQPRKTEEHLEI